MESSQVKAHRVSSQLLSLAGCLRVFLLPTLILTLAAMGRPVPRQILLCNVCPMQLKDKSCSNDFTSECQPNEHCGTSKGYFGSVHILTAQGCLTPDLCNSTHPLIYRGVNYNVTYRCCCSDQCNHLLAPTMHPC
ncbi:hypothetical protein UPYG_G00270550 [Umbra pygmaea]|uniref:Uncharacterized protein n=1 Tax=Umbra pygmaea TaxID=75934 RepID=A0ABD0WYD9_UMBPY